MTTKMDVARRLAAGAMCGVLLLGLAGCGSSPAQFLPNAVYIKKAEGDEPLKKQIKQDLVNLMAGLFGTPDDPQLPALSEGKMSDVVKLDLVQMSAGPVRRDAVEGARGLYREHCVHCHGVTGDGAGPTASFLNPYPRDFRMGVYKFKSTPTGRKPTNEDLKRTLIRGIPGTAMPSFKVLADDEIDSLVHYVKYLSIRGQVERELVDTIQIGDFELEDAGRLMAVSLQEKSPDEFSAQKEVVQEIVDGVAERWINAKDYITNPKNKPDLLTADEESRKQAIARGRELFFGLGGCVKCHGAAALGDGQTNDYDNWTKELDPKNEKTLKEYLALGALKPRNIKPRNLRLGGFRGGRRPIDIYRRIRNGIEGTPMPAATMLDPSQPGSVGLTETDIWNLVQYVRNLPYDPLSQPPRQEQTNVRERL